MEKLPEPRAILFDLGGTLLTSARWDPDAGTRRVLELARNTRGVGPEEVGEAIRALDSDLNARRASSWMEVSPWAVQRLVYEPLGIEIERTPHQIEAAFLEAARSWEPQPGVIDALRHVGTLGLPMAVISNSTFSSEALSAELDQAGLRGFFRFVMSSADYVVRKPHPALFHTAAGKLDVRPEGAWYVGDSPTHDVAGARSAGMVSVLYAPDGAEAEGPTPHATVASWQAFADLVSASM